MSLTALQAIQEVFNDPGIVALREWITPNGEIGVYQSREHMYLFALDRASGRYYMHPYNPDIKDQVIGAAEVVAAVAGAVEVTA